MAETVLGAVAVALVVWLLWPEDPSQQLHQEAAWQPAVQDTEPRRVRLISKGALDGTPGRSSVSPEVTAEPALTPEHESASSHDVMSRVGVRYSTLKPIGESERRRIAKPSELADRLDSFGRRTGTIAFEPPSRRPAGLITSPETSLVSAEQTVSGSAGPESHEVEPLSPSELARATELVEAALAVSPNDGAGLEQPLDVYQKPREKPVTEPLPEVDLSDLDALVPSDSGEPEAGEPEAKEPEISKVAALTPSPEGVIEPFDFQPDPSVPTTDVRSRPRDDAPTWLRNAVSVAVGDDRPMIAVVIDDLGLNRSNTAAFNSLPSPLTLSFLPYAGAIEGQTKAAHSAGHELMLHMPMEPLGSNWPGPDALTTKINQGEFTARLIKNLDRFDGFVGVNNHMGSRLTADRSRMDVVMHELRKRDVLFLDSKTSARSVASEAAGQNGVPNTGRDIFLDHVIDLTFIKRQLAATEKIAQQYGSAVAIGHPHGVTIQALRAWLPGLEARGFKLAPISAVVARRACRSNVLIAAETCGRYLQARSPISSTLTAQGG